MSEPPGGCPDLPRCHWRWMGDPASASLKNEPLCVTVIHQPIHRRRKPREYFHGTPFLHTEVNDCSKDTANKQSRRGGTHISQGQVTRFQVLCPPSRMVAPPSFSLSFPGRAGLGDPTRGLCLEILSHSHSKYLNLSTPSAFRGTPAPRNISRTAIPASGFAAWRPNLRPLVREEALGSSLEGWGLGAGTHAGPWGRRPQRDEWEESRPTQLSAWASEGSR